MPEKIAWWQWGIVPLCALLVVASTPYLTYGLYSKQLQEMLGVTEKQRADIQSWGIVGSMCFAFLPGILYDRYGYTKTLLCGGLSSTVGAVSWYLLLRDGGSINSPGWKILACGYFLMCFGARMQYFAGTCALLGAFPASMSGRMSATIAIFISFGYIILPLLWSTFFVPAGWGGSDLLWRAAQGLRPVAYFHLFLGTFFAFATVAGLCVAPLLPARTQAQAASPFRARLEKLSEKRVRMLICLLLFSVSVAYTYLGQAVARIGFEAGVSNQQLGHVVATGGLFNLAGRFVHGFGSDFLSRRCAGVDAAYVACLVATLCLSLAYGVLLVSYERTLTPHAWMLATYLVSFGFGGAFALFQGMVRATFGKEDFGFWLGTMFFILGSANFAVARLGAATAYDARFWQLALAASLFNALMFATSARSSSRKPAIQIGRALSTTPSVVPLAPTSDEV